MYLQTSIYLLTYIFFSDCTIMSASALTQDTPENRWMKFVVSATTQFIAQAILEIQSAFDKDSIVINDKTGQYLGTLTGIAVKIPIKLLLPPGVGQVIGEAAGTVADKVVGGSSQHVIDKYKRSKRYKSAKRIQRWLPGMYLNVSWLLGTGVSNSQGQN